MRGTTESEEDDRPLFHHHIQGKANGGKERQLTSILLILQLNTNTHTHRREQDLPTLHTLHIFGPVSLEDRTRIPIPILTHLRVT